MLDTAHIVISECPCCGHQTDRCSGVHVDHRPEPGDTTVCIECGAINRFDERMALQVVPDSVAALPEYEEARDVRAKVRQLRGLP